MFHHFLPSYWPSTYQKKQKKKLNPYFHDLTIRKFLFKDSLGFSDNILSHYSLNADSWLIKSPLWLAILSTCIKRQHETESIGISLDIPSIDNSSIENKISKKEFPELLEFAPREYFLNFSISWYKLANVVVTGCPLRPRLAKTLIRHNFDVNF